MHFEFDFSWLGHSVSLSALGAAFIGLAPPIAATVAVIWYSIQIYESRTFQHWKRNFVMKRAGAKLAKLEAKKKILLAEIAATERVRHAENDAKNLVAEAHADAAALIVTADADTKAAAIPAAPLK